MNLIKKAVLPLLFMYLLIPLDSLAMSESEQERLSLERSRSSSSSSLSDFIYSDVSGVYKRECLSIKLAPSDIQPPENIIPITLLQEQRRKYSPAIILSKDGDLIELLPDEILWRIFTFLDINDLGRVAQVSTRWNKIIETPNLWRFMGAKYYGDFLSEEDLRDKPKQKVVSHYLSVKVNSSSNLQEAESIVNRYHLDLYAHPFYTRLRVGLVEFFVTENVHQEELIMLGNPGAIEKKISKLMEGKFPHLRHIQEKHSQYKQDMAIIRELNDLLVEKGDRCAIGRKITGLGHEGGEYGYEENPLAAKELNDFLVEKGDSRAIERKFDGLRHGRLGYKKDLAALREFNDSLAEKGDKEAIHRKILGLEEGGSGYEKDLTALREFNESLVEKGDPRAIERKILGLAGRGAFSRSWGYKEDLEIAKKLNESLVEKRDQEAIHRKIEGLAQGIYGYEKNPLAARNLNESLIEKGNPGAIYRKIDGLIWGKYGYKQDRAAAREFNDYLVEKGDSRAIARKIEGLNRGEWGYEKDLTALRELNDFLVEKGDPRAIERKFEGLRNDWWGYKKDLAALRKLHDSLVEKGDLRAIERKISGLGTSGYGFNESGHYSYLGITYGYEKNPTLAREFIESLLLNEMPIVRGIGMYIKAAAMKYGLSSLGYEQDRDKAIQFIRDNHIPS